MFSGIVEGVARVVTIADQPGGKLLTVDLGSIAEGVAAGDSISVDGVCLTVVKLQGENCLFDVVAETIRKTTVGNFKAGKLVNIERSIRMGDRLDGHLVQGHIQGTGQLVERQDNKEGFLLKFKPERDLMKYIAPLGSVAVNGVSLTVAGVDDDSFAVALIPTTLKLTNMGQIAVGNNVNIETDMMARQMVHWAQSQKGNGK